MQEANCRADRIRDLFIDKGVLENSLEAIAGREQETGKASHVENRTCENMAAERSTWQPSSHRKSPYPARWAQHGESLD